MSLDAGFKIGGDKRACEDVHADLTTCYRRSSIGPCDPEQFAVPVATRYSLPNVHAFRELSNVPHQRAASLTSGLCQLIPARFLNRNCRAALKHALYSG